LLIPPSPSRAHSPIRSRGIRPQESLASSSLNLRRHCRHDALPMAGPGVA
jgi:hypothetical protein